LDDKEHWKKGREDLIEVAYLRSLAYWKGNTTME